MCRRLSQGYLWITFQVLLHSIFSLSTPEINRFLCLGNPTVRKDEPADAMVRDLGFNMPNSMWRWCGDLNYLNFWAKVPKNTGWLGASWHWRLSFWKGVQYAFIGHSSGYCSLNFVVLDYAIDWRGIANTLGGVFGRVSKWQASNSQFWVGIVGESP